jgi:hypothetical protein
VYHVNGKLGKSQTQPGSGEGCSGITTGYPVTVSGKAVALLRQGTANAWGDLSACERTGRRTEIESGGSGGTSPQHRTKSSNYYKPDTYTRRSCAERHVFTPGGPLRLVGICN